jgi:DNA ligase (NAD+)
MSNPNQTMIENLLGGKFDQYDIDDITAMLAIADDEYTNDGEITSFVLDDPQYDFIKLNAKRLDPANVYFTGVGADVRGGKVELPNAMPSLNQVEIGEIAGWVTDNNLHDEDTVITDKMDGTSLQVIYDKNGDLQIAYSRGNGLQGADVTRHVRRIQSIPNKIDTTGGLEVRCEVEIADSEFEILKTKVMSRSGRPYKNPRNMIAGMMNSKVIDEERLPSITVFGYEIMRSSLPKKDMLIRLEELGFTVVEWTVCKGSGLTDDSLAEYLNKRRDVLDFAIDGIVIDVNDENKRAAMDVGITGKANPNSSVKYKVADADNFHVATVAGVTYNTSKHGYHKPQINFEPFDLCGVTISNTNGFNAGFIRDNKIGAGTKLLMTRSGDVIPYVVKVIEGTDAVMPDGDNVWTESKTDLMLRDPESCDTVRLQRMVDFTLSLELPYLREGNLQKLFDAGYDSIDKLVHCSEADLIVVLGTNGTKAYLGMQKRFDSIHFHDVIGSTCFFGRGLGKRKFKKLFEGRDWEMAGPVPNLANVMDHKAICSIESFKEKTADKIINGMPAFIEFFNATADVFKYIDPADIEVGDELAGEKIVFTGFRDKDLKAAVEAAGGTMQSSISGKTTLVVTTNPSGTSSKLKKARDQGTPIISVDDLRARLY